MYGGFIVGSVLKCTQTHPTICAEFHCADEDKQLQPFHTIGFFSRSPLSFGKQYMHLKQWFSDSHVGSEGTDNKAKNMD